MERLYILGVALPTVVGKLAIAKNSLPTVVGKLAIAKNSLPTVVGKLAIAKNSLPTVVGKLATCGMGTVWLTRERGLPCRIMFGKMVSEGGQGT